jgi:hypothetical protein
MLIDYLSASLVRSPSERDGRSHDICVYCHILAQKPKQVHPCHKSGSVQIRILPKNEFVTCPLVDVTPDEIEHSLHDRLCQRAVSKRPRAILNADY